MITTMDAAGWGDGWSYGDGRGDLAWSQLRQREPNTHVSEAYLSDRGVGWGGLDGDGTGIGIHYGDQIFRADDPFEAMNYYTT